MFISPHDKFVFVSTTKCATNSMWELLPKVFPDGYFLVNGVLKKGSRPRPFHSNVVPKEYRDLFTWSIVRNPYARAVSLWWSTTVDPTKTLKQKYCYVELGTTDFTKFLHFLLTKPHMLVGRHLAITQTRWLRDVKLDRTLRLESLERDLITLPFWQPDIKVPVSNPSHARKSWTHYMNEERAALIREWCDEDFNTFGYSREWRP